MDPESSGETMSVRDTINLLTLAALWGISFLLIRVAAPEFGAIPLIAVRVALAALVLLPIVCVRRGLLELRTHWRAVVVVGMLHYAIPFSLFAWAMLTLTGGYSAVINASSPLFAAAIAVPWLGERLPLSRIAGLAAGFAGVVVLVHGELGGGAVDTILPVGAALTASLCYGLAAVVTRSELADVEPVNVAAGSMTVAAIALLPGTIWLWPDASPSSTAWCMAVILGLACTALAFILYFSLITRIGPVKTISVTFLIPVFAVGFGWLFLDETVTATMMFGGLIVLAGTGLATGLLRRSPRRHAIVTQWSRQS
jgi:drug/metabolite transporter (DMT)-like permease